jgi:hypothetical protein
MSTNPYQSPREAGAEAATSGLAETSDGLHEYLLSARSLARKKVTERVEAASADAAVEILRQRGFTEIVLHTDDIGALFTQQSKREPHVTPKDYVGFRHLSGYWGRVGFHARKLYAQSWQLKIPLLVLLIARRWMGARWGLTDYLTIGFLSMPLAFALIGQFNSRALRYHKVLELVAWGRWAEVLEQSGRLNGRLPEHEILWMQAKALAGLGRINEAIQLVAPIADDPTVPQWLYCSRLAGVYTAAEMRDEQLALNEKALDLAPENATLLIDTAMALLRYQLDTPRARQLLEQARSHALSDVLVPSADAVEGMLLLEEGRPQQANSKLLAGLKGLDRFRNATPLMGAIRDRFRAYLALSFAAMGDRSAAERELRLVEPRLRALKREDLLTRCQRALETLAPTPEMVAGAEAQPAASLAAAGQQATNELPDAQALASTFAKQHEANNQAAEAAEAAVTRTEAERGAAEKILAEKTAAAKAAAEVATADGQASHEVAAEQAQAEKIVAEKQRTTKGADDALAAADNDANEKRVEQATAELVAAEKSLTEKRMGTKTFADKASTSAAKAKAASEDRAAAEIDL